VAGDDRDAEVAALGVDGTPDRIEVGLAHLRRQGQRDGEVRRGEAGDGDVREDDADGEAARPLPAELREDRDRVRRGHEGVLADGDHPEVDAVSRADGDVVPVGAEPGGDVLLEERPRDLAGVHTGGSAPRGLGLSATGLRSRPRPRGVPNGRLSAVSRRESPVSLYTTWLM
jgi:hypothetical protein